jgi:hypothetical protein
MDDEILTEALSPGPDCLSIEDLARFSDHAMSGDQLAAARRHVASCMSCQAELELLQRFATSEISDDEQAIVRSGVEQLRRREREIFGDRERVRPAENKWIAVGWIRSSVALAASLLLIAAGYYLFRPAPSGFPTDASVDRGVTRSLTIGLVAPVGDLGSAPDRLQWQPVAGARGYHVRVLEVDRHELWSADVAATSVELPSVVKAQFAPGKTLLWHVTANDSSSRALAESELQQFRVVR